MSKSYAVPGPTLRHESNATVTTGSSAVSFVPTDQVQTAVSNYGDYIVIDTLVPPSRYLPPTLSVAKLAGQIQTDLVSELNRLGLGMGSRVASIAHPRSKEVEAEQFVRTPSGDLIDPALSSTGHPGDSRRAHLGVRSLRGEPLLTYFPPPAAAEPTSVGGQVTTCPCVCCRSHCVGADPQTKRLPILTGSLAADEAGNALVSAPSAKELVPSTSEHTALGAPFSEAPSPRSIVRLVDGKREVRSVAPHKSLGDLRTTAAMQQPVPALHASRRHLTPPSRKVETWEEEPRPAARITVRPSGALGTAQIPVSPAPPTRAEKGMSVFAPLQLSQDLESQLVLDESYTQNHISPPRGVHTTPPLSSPSSYASSRYYRETDSSPGSAYSVDPSSTPIAARYSRSTSNLRQKAAKDRELPPLPPMPTTIPAPIQPMQPTWAQRSQPAAQTPVKAPAHSTPPLQYEATMGQFGYEPSGPSQGTRVRVIAGNSPLNRNVVRERA